MQQLREIHLYKPMRQWFVDRGYEVRPEFCVRSKHFDAIAVKNDIVIAIEMKMVLSKALYFQISRARAFADYSYVAVATNPRRTARFFKQLVHEGIGVLSVKNDVVIEILAPVKKIDWDNGFFRAYHQKAIDYVKQTKDRGIAGKPQMKGEGPAQETWRAIVKYRLKHPKATWKEMYKNIPNHYSNHLSMQSSMSQVPKNRVMATDWFECSNCGYIGIVELAKKICPLCKRTDSLTLLDEDE